MEKRIVPHLWFDKSAKEAATFYTGLFADSRIVSVNSLHGTPSGDVETIDFVLAGQPFEAISAGPYFTFTPSFSLTVACETAEEVDRLWSALSQGGTVMMELDAYPFSPRYGWVADRYGLHWQLTLSQGIQPAQKIMTTMLFSDRVNGMAEEAARFYATVFPDSDVSFVHPYEQGEAQSVKAKNNYVAFQLNGLPFAAMDNGFDVDYTFSEAFSLMVYCDTQAEIDHYWTMLSHVPEAEACGWVKDRYGVSWQIVPKSMGEMLAQATEEQKERITTAFLAMKKLDVAALTAAFEGR